MKFLLGGLGDLFLSLERAIDEGTCDVYSHFIKAPEFLESFGVKINKFFYYSSVENHPSLNYEDYIGHDIFPKIPLTSSEEIDNIFLEKPVIAIHPFGSELSNRFWTKHNQPIKFISNENINYLIDSLEQTFKVLVLGTESELSSLDILEKYKKSFNLKDLTYAISKCHSVIGTDSSIKTISSAQKIKTYVVIGNYSDQARDTKFLIPYMKNEIMEVGAYSKEQNRDLFIKIVNKIIKDEVDF